MQKKLDYSSLWHSLLPLYDSREAQAVVRMVLEEKFGLSLTDIVSGGLERLEAGQQPELQSMMKRLQSGEPVQYVLGYSWFCGRKFHVEPGVLIPRPETEQMCNLIIQNSKFKIQNSANATLNAQCSTLNLLDIGTGSGCIAITLALAFPEARVYALDISDDALRIASSNAKALHAPVTFLHGDILHPDGMASPLLEKDVKGDGLSGLTLIVSNPPYVTISERQAMSRTILDHEPSLALFVPDDDPLLYYRAIARYSVSNLAPGGMLWLEINPLFAERLQQMLHDMGFESVEILADDYGRLRYAIALL